jgi:hypothetical protein
VDSGGLLEKTTKGERRTLLQRPSCVNSEKLAVKHYKFSGNDEAIHRKLSDKLSVCRGVTKSWIKGMLLVTRAFITLPRLPERQTV